MNKIKWLGIALLLLLAFTGCEKLQFDDPTTLTVEEALDVTEDYYFKLSAGAFSNAVFYANDGYYFGMGIGALADQITVTNRVQEWWDFAYEPRKRLNNSQSYGGVYHFNRPYAAFYQANLDATKALTGLDAGNVGVDSEGNDRTQEVYAIAYLAKGLAQAHLGAIYDRGIIVDEDLGSTGTADFPNSYKELIESGIGYIDKAITAANTASSITVADFYPGVELDKTLFIQFANSMAARLLASLPRDKSEAAALGSSFWNRVYNYASAGVTSDIILNYISGGYYNYNVYYAGYLTATTTGNEAAYLPQDIKVAFLADKTGNYPSSYPTDATVLGEVETDDARFSSFFGYTTNFGYLREDRGRNLFSNYYLKRWRQNTTASGGVVTAGLGKNPLFMANETLLLKAESKLWLGDYASAASELNASSAERKSLGNLADVGASEAALRFAIHYEYSISLSAVSGSINPWTFMRRNDLLQVGTPTEFPIPEQQMLLTSNPTVYTFGGVDYAGEIGKWGEVTTATGIGAWPSSK